MYKIRVILDTKEDVIRTININNDVNLEELHQIIATAFGFNGQEMASFYTTNDDWNQGEEIPLFDMSELNDGLSMSSCILNTTLPHVTDKLIYVYDFLHLWTFYIEVLEIDAQMVENNYQVILSIGEVPETAPDKEFKATLDTDDMMNEFEGDDFDNEDFDNFDDFDFDQY